MKKIAISIILLILCVDVGAQAEASNWYFGDRAGIRFDSDGSVTELLDGKLNTIEGCTTISDKNGGLLFYTDGITVYNKLHQAMSNANGSPGNILFGDPSSSQSAIVVPKPNDPNIYYIFTVDTSVNEDDPDYGFNYSVVDLTLNGGLGDVVASSKNINLLNDSSEKISAVLKDCESQNIWVITFGPAKGVEGNPFDTFFAYEVSASGVNTVPVTSTFDIEIGDPRGYLKFSPNGSKLASANVTGGLYIYDFDAKTGKIDTPKKIDINFSHALNRRQSPYGVEFSPNNDVLYVSTYFSNSDDNQNYGALLQYNLIATNISESEVILDERPTYRGALQLGPNGKIYRAMSNYYGLPKDEGAGLPFLSVINNPNNLGIAANYEHAAISLQKKSRQGLPPFITSFFSEKIDIIKNEISSTYLPLCLGETYILESKQVATGDYTWKRNGIILANKSYKLEVSSPGFYEVSINTFDDNCGIITGEALVEYFEMPNAIKPNDVIICDNDNDGISDFNFTDFDSIILGTQNDQVYTVSYHITQLDADLNNNPIQGVYRNTNTTEKIFIRLGINGNESCFDTSKSFNISVFSIPIANNVTAFETCDSIILEDDDPYNGRTIIKLNQFNSQILGLQNEFDYNITYHISKSDAELDIKPLDFSYYNSNQFNEIVYGRIENKLGENCYSITNPILIKINPIPKAFNHKITQCDEDGLSDGFTQFNLSEANSELGGGVTGLSTTFYLDSARSIRLDDTSYANISNPQTIYVEVMDDTTECIDYSELVIEVSLTNSINTELIACDDDGIEDGFYSFNLRNADNYVVNGLPVGLDIFYYETYSDALLEQNRLDDEFTNTFPYSQIIYARVENNNNCYGISEVSLTVNGLPDLVTEDIFYYCLNKFPETITIDVSIVNDSPSNYSYSWSTGDNTYEVEINEVGTYLVEVTNMNGCTKLRTIEVQPSNTATFDTNPYKVEDPLPNNTITVFVSGEGNYEYALYDENNTAIYRGFQESNLFENVFPGIYTINVRDVKNDCGTVNISVSVIGFPKFFTPNNDGFHDTWQVYGLSRMFQPNSKIKIYDRYGKLLKQITPLGAGWDGTFNGAILPTDDYWFSVVLQDGRIFKSHFTLKR